MPNGANSIRRCCVKTLRAAFEVGYAEYVGMVTYTDAGGGVDYPTLGRAQRR
jgi:hypothetical protein